METKESVLYVRFEDEAAERLRELSKRRDKTVASIVRAAVDQYLKRQPAVG